jgi:chromatin structure-remodeling complex subunit SFH1
MRHKKDAIEWGVIGGERADAIDEHAGTPAASGAVGGERARDNRGAYGTMKDKTGLGLGLGRAPRDGRGPKTLRSVWRDWAEADEFRTVFEELTAEDIEKREVERERATRYFVLFFFDVLMTFFFS